MTKIRSLRKVIKHEQLKPFYEINYDWINRTKYHRIGLKTKFDKLFNQIGLVKYLKGLNKLCVYNLFVYLNSHILNKSSSVSDCTHCEIPKIRLYNTSSNIVQDRSLAVVSDIIYDHPIQEFDTYLYNSVKNCLELPEYSS